MNAEHRFLLPRPGGSGRYTRRTFLLTALLGLTVGGLAASRSPAGTAPDPCVEPRWSHKTIGDRQSAARIGRAYLDLHPNYRRCHRLIADIEKALKRQDASFSLTADAEQTGSALQRLVRKEFTRGEVVSVAGWVLSGTEARLYALTAMSV
jgi:hypothetical protein